VLVLGGLLTAGGIGYWMLNQANTRADIYHQLNQKCLEAAPTILLSVPLARHYEQRWVQGYYYNVTLADASNVTYFYALSKK
jgi:hypothetical protein